MLAIDYLTKWVDTKSYIQVKDIDVGIFIWKNIICHFGIPWIIVADNESQFIPSKVNELYDS